jgi:hypothetical protein
MSDMKPIKTLRLNRETVKRLGVRSNVRTGAAYNSDGGNSAAGKASPPRMDTAACGVADTFACNVLGGGINIGG